MDYKDKLYDSIKEDKVIHFFWDIRYGVLGFVYSSFIMALLSINVPLGIIISVGLFIGVIKLIKKGIEIEEYFNEKESKQYSED